MYIQNMNENLQELLYIHQAYAGTGQKWVQVLEIIIRELDSIRESMRRIDGHSAEDE